MATLSGSPLFPEGTECALTPITFDLVGTWDEGAMTTSLSQNNVSLPDPHRLRIVQDGD